MRIQPSPRLTSRWRGMLSIGAWNSIATEELNNENDCVSCDVRTERFPDGSVRHPGVAKRPKVDQILQYEQSPPIIVPSYCRETNAQSKRRREKSRRYKAIRNTVLGSDQQRGTYNSTSLRSRSLHSNVKASIKPSHNRFRRLALLNALDEVDGRKQSHRAPVQFQRPVTWSEFTSNMALSPNDNIEAHHRMRSAVLNQEALRVQDCDYQTHPIEENATSSQMKKPPPVKRKAASSSYYKSDSKHPVKRKAAQSKEAEERDDNPNESSSEETDEYSSSIDLEKQNAERKRKELKAAQSKEAEETDDNSTTSSSEDSDEPMSSNDLEKLNAERERKELKQEEMDFAREEKERLKLLQGPPGNDLIKGAGARKYDEMNSELFDDSMGSQASINSQGSVNSNASAVSIGSNASTQSQAGTQGSNASQNQTIQTQGNSNVSINSAASNNGSAGGTVFEAGDGAGDDVGFGSINYDSIG
eukprot:GHVH01001047.1.p1 GENE.GHVH01001047.1~~GHVH01001047.1.p1  ORF type:complete len:474 (+),score=81.57 GHVH01001047.1:37-1458(+)